MTGGGGGESEIKVLTRAVQQLNMLPMADTKSHFWQNKPTGYPILIVLEWTNEKLVT